MNAIAAMCTRRSFARGALVLAFDAEQRAHVEHLLRQGEENGVEGLRILERDEVLAMEPHVNPAVHCALYAPTSGLTSPYELTCALADHAAVNGVAFQLNTEVRRIERTAEGFAVETNRGSLHADILVNCAGGVLRNAAQPIKPSKADDRAAPGASITCWITRKYRCSAIPCSRRRPPWAKVCW